MNKGHAFMQTAHDYIEGPSMGCMRIIILHYYYDRSVRPTTDMEGGGVGGTVDPRQIGSMRL